MILKSILLNNSRFHLATILIALLCTISKAVSQDISKKGNSVAKSKKNNGTTDFDLLPDGKSFAFWEDQTKYSKILHVAQNNLKASDNNAGTSEMPLKTINAAAQLLRAGEKVIVHEGIYRECVRPATGGSSAASMISYEAARGEKVVVKGSEVWKPVFRPSSGWRLDTAKQNPDIKILMADIPEGYFKAYNPFLVRNVYREIIQYGRPGEPQWMKRAMLYRGAVYVNGRQLKQVFDIKELTKIEDAFWVEEPGLRLHVSFSKKIDPSKLFIEITTREQIFAPKDFGLGYIRINGFAFEHAADEIPVPQRAAVSAMRGHHWIIENNRIEWVNASGLDIGTQSWDAELLPVRGGHIVRNNVVRNIGLCGIAGGGLDHTLIESNLIEHVGYLDLERNAEAAGLKFHGCKNTLVRQNIFRYISHASGLWFDVNASNCRIVDNFFADIKSILGGVFMEVNRDQNLIDQNIFWDIQDDKIDANPPLPTVWNYADGTGIRSDCNEKLIVAHNLFGKITNHAVSLNTFQNQRMVNGRGGFSSGNKVVNNIFFNCPNRIYLSSKLDNVIDGNLYDVKDVKNSKGSFLLVYPEPYTFQNLKGWQDFFGFDKHATEAKINVSFDVETCLLEISIEGDMSQSQMLNDMKGKITSEFLGPFIAGKNQKSMVIKQKFPRVRE